MKFPQILILVLIGVFGAVMITLNIPNKQDIIKPFNEPVIETDKLDDSLQEDSGKIPEETTQNQPTKVLVDSNTQEKSVTPVVEKQVEPLQITNNVQTEVHIPASSLPATVYIVEQPAPEQTPQAQSVEMPSQDPTYTVKKGADTIQTSISLEELRSFVSSLNTYMTWKKKAQTASVEELEEMLTSNGYTLIKN